MQIDATKVKDAILKLELMSSTENLRDEIPLQEQGMDSLDLANLLLHFEESCGIRIPDPEAEKAHSIQEIVLIVNAKLASQP